MISESDIEPVRELPHINRLEKRADLLRETAMIKLNGGLGTSMGLSGPKGLLEVKDGKDFYAILLEQVRAFQEREQFQPPLLFMNSFNTKEETESRLRELKFEQSLPWGFLQSQVPKITEDGTLPEGDEEHAWCPPGHGDIYASLLDSGLKEKLLEAGIRFLFVSNIDNLGAVLDSRPLQLMEDEGLDFLMEVTRRGEGDKKGGHLARTQDGRLLLREVAQCPEEDLPHFQNIEKHRYFNTNNLWIRLEAIDESWTDLPLIVNRKPFNPQEPTSQKVVQLEQAMGAAIGTVTKTGALEVDRDRFKPVKTTNDLFLLRSDLFELSPKANLKQQKDALPVINLDPEHYKLIDDFDRLVKGVPSLLSCEALQVTGPVVINSDLNIEGKAHLKA